MARRFGPAQPRGRTWKGAGAWAMVSQSRQENFSRTVWITFHWRGITSSVSVTSSPSFDRRDPPQQAQAVGASITTRSRGRCSGKGWREGFLRSNPFTVVVARATAFSAASSSSVAEASSSSSCSSSWSSSRLLRSDVTPKRSRFSLAICSCRWAISAWSSARSALAAAASATARAAFSSARVAFSSARTAPASAWSARSSAAASALFSAATSSGTGAAMTSMARIES